MTETPKPPEELASEVGQEDSAEPVAEPTPEPEPEQKTWTQTAEVKNPYTDEDFDPVPPPSPSPEPTAVEVLLRLEKRLFSIESLVSQIAERRVPSTNFPGYDNILTKPNYEAEYDAAGYEETREKREKARKKPAKKKPSAIKRGHQEASKRISDYRAKKKVPVKRKR